MKKISPFFWLLLWFYYTPLYAGKPLFPPNANHGISFFGNGRDCDDRFVSFPQQEIQLGSEDAPSDDIRMLGVSVEHCVFSPKGAEIEMLSKSVTGFSSAFGFMGDYINQFILVELYNPVSSEKIVVKGVLDSEIKPSGYMLLYEINEKEYELYLQENKDKKSNVIHFDPTGKMIRFFTLDHVRGITVFDSEHLLVRQGCEPVYKMPHTVYKSENRQGISGLMTMAANDFHVKVRTSYDLDLHTGETENSSFFQQFELKNDSGCQLQVENVYLRYPVKTESSLFLANGLFPVDLSGKLDKGKRQLSFSSIDFSDASDASEEDKILDHLKLSDTTLCYSVQKND